MQPVISVAAKVVDSEVTPSKGEKTVSQRQGLAEFMSNHHENIDKAIRRQVEFYFGDANFLKDKYLQKKCSENPERYISIKEVMSFNKMRSLTKS